MDENFNNNYNQQNNDQYGSYNQNQQYTGYDQNQQYGGYDQNQQYGNYNQGQQYGGYDQNQQYQQQYQQPYYQQPFMTAELQKADKNATAALVLGIISILCCAPCGIAGIILGHSSRKVKKEDNPKALAGFILSIIGVSLWGLGIICYLFAFTSNANLF